MNKKTLAILWISSLAGCSSAYEKAYQGLIEREDHEGGYYYTYWVELEKYSIDPNSSSDQDIAKLDLQNCKLQLEVKELTKRVKNTYIASVSLLDCMSKKGWKAIFSSVTLLM